MQTRPRAQAHNGSAIKHFPSADKINSELLDRVRRAVRVRNYSIRTERSYTDWVYRFILFHRKRHPMDMGAREINAFLSYLATDLNVAASTQNQACCAVVFLYKHVLKKELGGFGEIVRAKKPKRLPVVLSAEEAAAVLDELAGRHRLMGELLYGTGMRIIELVRLRVKDVDFNRRIQQAKREQTSAEPQTTPPSADVPGEAAAAGGSTEQKDECRETEIPTISRLGKRSLERFTRHLAKRAAAALAVIGACSAFLGGGSRT